MKSYLTLLVLLVSLNSFSNDLIEFNGLVEFSETDAGVGNILVEILSLDLTYDTSVFTDKNGLFKVYLPENQYSLMISNDSLIGSENINLLTPMTRNIVVHFNYLNDYKIFKTGFEQIYTGKNFVTIGLKSNGEFRRTVFVGDYAAYSFIENGLYQIKGDTIVTKTCSIDSYIKINKDLTGQVEYYAISGNSVDDLVDKSSTRYKLVNYKELEKMYKED